jgi:hypothetical protein
MTAANITFVGSGEVEEGSDVPSFTWGGLDFALNTPVLVDPDAAETAELRRHYEYMIIKARTHPALTIEEVEPEPPARRRVKGRDDEDNGEDEPANGDYDLSTLPKDWRDLHHKKIIAIARRLGGEGEALATRDGAIEYVEEQLALGVPQKEEVPF